MSHGILIQLSGILILGITAQWVAWRVRLPSILILLVVGIIAGPVVGWLKPERLLGDLLLPLVSLSVAVILYEGGLNLKFRELSNIGGVFFLLITVGALVTWLVSGMAAYYVLGLPWQVATLLGAILIVTGPTVIGPILRHIRLRGKVGALLKWEGIVIDPLGATLAVLVFAVIQAGGIQVGIANAAGHLGMTLVAGVLCGGIAAGSLVLVLSKFWVPDALRNPVSLMLMFAAFTTANVLQTESGLLAVTVMGIALANQKWVPIRHLVEFKETISVMLISCLFIVLAARLRPEDLRSLGWESLAFVAIMILVARPLCVFLSTWGSALTWPERSFLACMAPRGIVAAAVSSEFALRLQSTGLPNTIEMVSVTFLLVFITVLLYGLSAAPLARYFKLIHANPQGILFIGAPAWARTAAVALKEEGYSVFLIDTDWDNVRSCRMASLPCLYGSALAEHIHDEIDYSGLGRMLAVTSNDEVNSLACLRYVEDFGRQEVYQLTFPSTKEGRYETVSQEHRGRALFGPDLTFHALQALVGPQPKVRKTKLTAEFNLEAFRREHGSSVLPIFILKPDESIQVCTVSGSADPKSGDRIISFDTQGVNK